MIKMLKIIFIFFNECMKCLVMIKEKSGTLVFQTDS